MHALYSCVEEKPAAAGSAENQVKIERRYLLLHRAWLKRRHPPFSQRLVPVFWGKQLAPFLPFLSDWYWFYLPVHRNNTEVQHYLKQGECKGRDTFPYFPITSS